MTFWNAMYLAEILFCLFAVPLIRFRFRRMERKE